MRRASMLLVAMMATCLIARSGHAKISEPVWQAIQETYAPAVWNEGLETAYVNPDPSKLRNFVVVMVGGMAAERARRFITWAEYDYRGVTVDLAKETVKNRRGDIYTYLQPGDVMAVAKLDKMGNTVYMGLISPGIYKPANREQDKHFSRVTNTVKFKLPPDIAEGDDPAPVLNALSQWLKPFKDVQAALMFAPTVGTPGTQTLSPLSPAEFSKRSYKFNPRSAIPPGLKFTNPDYD